MGISILVKNSVARNRHDICKTNECGEYEDKWDRCKMCGCFLSLKTKLKSSSCPKDFWNKPENDEKTV